MQLASISIKTEPQQLSQVATTAKAAPFVAPLIHSVSHDALVVWKREREQYEAQVRAQCISNGEKPARLMVPVKQTMDYALLQTCCKFMWHTSAQSITDEELVHKLTEIVNCGMNTPRLDLEALLQQKLRMNLNERDLHARIIQYFMDFETIVKQTGLCCSGAEGMTSKCELLVKYMAPDRLRDRVVVHQRFVDNGSRTCDVKLFKLVLETALELEKPQQQVVKPKRDAQTANLDTEPLNQEPSRGHKRRLNEDTPVESKTVAQMDHSKSVEQQQSTAAPYRVCKSCLHCGRPHLVRSCPYIGAEEKLRLRAEFNRKQRERIVRTST